MNTLSDYVSRLLRPSKILLVEDDQMICEIIWNLAQKFNCELTIVNSAKEASAVIPQTRFDLIFLDYKLPDGNGVEIFRQIRSISEEIPVCIVTGYLTEELIDRIREIGFAVFVQKPHDLVFKNLISLFATFGIKPKQPQET